MINNITGGVGCSFNTFFGPRYLQINYECPTGWGTTKGSDNFDHDILDHNVVIIGFVQLINHC